MEISKKQKIALISFGSVVGILLGIAFGFFLKSILSKQLPAGAEFENLSDFRQALSEHDSRDTNDGDSVSLRTLIQANDSDLIIYTLKPNLDVKFKGVNVRTNSFGLRGPEVNKTKPENTYRILFLGDSFTFGWGVQEEKTFVRVMESELNASNKFAKKVEVLNFGVPGYSTFQEVELLKEKGLEFNPDAVIIYFVENDFGLPFFIKNFSSPSKQLVNNKNFAKLKDESEDSEFEKDNQKLLRSLDANKALRILSQICQEKNIVVHLVVNPNKKYEKQLARLWILKEEKYIRILNVRNDVKEQITASGISPADLQLPKDPHPNAIKHGFIGKSLAKFITN